MMYDSVSRRRDVQFDGVWGIRRNPRLRHRQDVDAALAYDAVNELRRLVTSGTHVQWSKVDGVGRRWSDGGWAWRHDGGGMLEAVPRLTVYGYVTLKRHLVIIILGLYKSSSILKRLNV